ncbi:MAG: hypothetical protein LBN99_01285 [Oscillospiraceae bacterium]|nr:hypothetical protein [Oscillospiraceae bacterium]
MDTRPPEMKRSTMPYWVQVCPECGYASSEVSRELSCSKEFLQTDEYKSFSLPEPVSGLTKAFIQKARIESQSDKYSEAWYSYLCAAWAADDKGDSHWARQSRLLSLEQIGRIAKDEQNENLTLIRADLLRKTGQHQRLLNEYSETRLSEEFLNNILSFQLKKAREEDEATYTAADIE